MLKLNNRLSAAASFIKRGSRIADIGTDHALLPIWLVLNNITTDITAADINDGPLEKAKINIASYGLSDKIRVVKTDGLHGIADYLPDTVVICGMGGELIRNIVNAAPFVKKNRTRLILQPMTRAPLLRRFLYDNGFDITGEALAYDDKLYEIICAEYDGIKHKYTEIELLIGKKNIENNGELLRMHIMRRLEVLSKKINGQKKAAIDSSENEKLAAELADML